MNREEEKTSALSTELRTEKRKGVLRQSFGEGCRRRAEHNGEIVTDLAVGAVAAAFAMTHVAFGVYPFSLALLFASTTRLIPILFGAAVGCTFINRPRPRSVLILTAAFKRCIFNKSLSPM